MAEQQAAPISAEIMAAMRTDAEESFAYWRANATEEQKAVGLAELEKWTNDEAFGASEMAVMAAAFTAAGPNAAGCLNQAGFMTFIADISAKSAARGNFEDTRPEYRQRTYALCNRFNPATDGVTMADFGTIVEAYSGISEELKNAAGL